MTQWVGTGMGMHAKTRQLLKEAGTILRARHPMTVRQVFYQLVSRHVIENTRSQDQTVSNLLVNARKTGAIPWEWIEDRLRRPRTVSMWDGLADFAEAAHHAYRQDVWQTQPGLVEVWLEKDALSGIVEDLLGPYGVALNVGRGYEGWDSIRNAALRYGDGSHVTVLYLGDLDPSGEDMVRSLKERLGFFDSRPEIVKVCLTLEDVERHQLPPDFTKTSDTRRAQFVKRFGDIAVELDALPVQVLQEKIQHAVESRMDLAALEAVRGLEALERADLSKRLTRPANE